MVVGHAHIVDQNANIQVLKLGADTFVDLSAVGKVNIDNTSFDSVSRFCGRNKFLFNMYIIFQQNVEMENSG